MTEISDDELNFIVGTLLNMTQTEREQKIDWWGPMMDDSMGEWNKRHPGTRPPCFAGRRVPACFTGKLPPIYDGELC